MTEQVYGFDRDGERWQEWSGRAAGDLASLLDYNADGRDGDGGGLREGSMLCAPLVTRDGLIGILKIAARYPAQLKPYDGELVEHFRSQAAVAIQNLHRTASLRARVVTAERKHAMAELARGVSHDVNNALGSMLPLVQQMQEDLRSGIDNPDVRAKTSSRFRNRCRSAAGFSAACCRFHAAPPGGAGMDTCGGRSRRHRRS